MVSKVAYEKKIFYDVNFNIYLLRISEKCQDSFFFGS